MSVLSSQYTSMALWVSIGGSSSGIHGHHVGSAQAADGSTVSFVADKVVGNGSFGVVYQATIVETNEVVAIKKVLQDKRFKNRELQIMRTLHHPNVCTLKHCFYSNGDKPDELYLNLVLEFVPETIYRMARQ